ncbi:hypothetical protein [Sphingomonas mollis]|uniref:Uncharacterized protein n=1 Tax=Sphingomonas mollis TaxID=2795726 RepID=A0ABS0XQQ0_9SPHN|nr:hypothetical protein [Sphingomonas sp. BT553]MBJ6122075.1 hypothetical protein [Sphingomonas sp. BT553]
MMTTTIADIPACALLPMADRPFLRAARDIALLADGLLATRESPLLALSLPSDGWAGAYPIVMWDDRLQPCARRIRTACESPMMSPALDALCLAADAMHDRLIAWRWSEVAARGLCAITDGTGVALIGEAPTPGIDWLVRMPLLATIVVPFASDGVWSLLTAEVNPTVH